MRDRSEFDDLAPLIKQIRAHPPFDRETELVVTRKSRKGNKRAQEQLVLHNLSLVISVARKFMGRGVRLEDLVQGATTASSRPSSTSTPRRATASRPTRCGGSAPTSRARSRTARRPCAAPCPTA